MDCNLKKKMANVFKSLQSVSPAHFKKNMLKTDLSWRNNSIFSSRSSESNHVREEFLYQTFG